MHNMEAIAAKTLKQYGINQLPVDLDLLAEKLDCIILSYCKGQKFIKEAGLLDKCAHRNGIAVHTEMGYRIFYNGNLSFDEKQFVVAHELAHIILHLKNAGRIIGEHEDPLQQKKQDQEANELGLYLLAPKPVLFRAGICTPREVAQATQLGQSHAREIAGELAKYTSGRDFSAIDEALCQQFSEYIDNCRSYRYYDRNRLIKRLLTGFAAVFVIAGAAFFFFQLIRILSL